MSKFLLFFALLLLFPSFLGAQSQDIFINEIAWMGTISSANEEWIEIKNNGLEPVNLEKWVLKSSDNKLVIPLKGTILGQNYFLLKRNTAQNTLLMPPDISYAGALNNSGMNLLLFDQNNTLVDEANFLGKWTLGDNETKRTLERTTGGWQTSKDAGGTPRSINSVGYQKPTSTPKQSTLPKVEKSVNSKDVSADFTAINKPSSTYSQPFMNPWLLLQISLGITLISATILLIYKFHVRS